VFQARQHGRKTYSEKETNMARRYSKHNDRESNRAECGQNVSHKQGKVEILFATSPCHLAKMA
jgi:hypothetical protein